MRGKGCSWGRGGGNVLENVSPSPPPNPSLSSSKIFDLIESSPPFLRVGDRTALDGASWGRENGVVVPPKKRMRKPSPRQAAFRVFLGGPSTLSNRRRVPFRFSLKKKKTTGGEDNMPIKKRRLCHSMWLSHQHGETTTFFSGSPLGGIHAWGILLVIPLAFQGIKHQPFSMTQPTRTLFLS